MREPEIFPAAQRYRRHRIEAVPPHDGPVIGLPYVRPSPTPRTRRYLFLHYQLLERCGELLVRHVGAFPEVVRRTGVERHFRSDAWVVLPDHLHTT